MHNNNDPVMGFLVEPNGEYYRVNLVEHPLHVLFGRRRYDDWGFDARPDEPYATPGAAKERTGDIVLNRSSIMHDPMQHDGHGPRNCIEAWTVTAGDLGQGDNPIGRAILMGLPCFASRAIHFCHGRMVFIGWGGRSLVAHELDKIFALAKEAEKKK